MALLYYAYVRRNQTAFINKVIAISKKLDINPNWLMLVMWMESQLDEKAINKINGASGLIQFITSTAKGLGYTLEQVRAMSNVQQLDLVYAYFKPYAKYINSFTDLYLITFYPAALINKKPDSWDFPKIVYDFNKGLDRNKDGKINLGEFKKFILSKVPKSIPPDELKKKAFQSLLSSSELEQPLLSTVKPVNQKKDDK